MQENIESLKWHVRETSANPAFVHNKWFVKWHLEIVERIATELLGSHPEADKDLVIAMVWMHDYGKILDFDKQYDVTQTAGKTKLLELGFDKDFTQQVIDNIATLDHKLTEDLTTANIEVQIVSSADGCSHMVGPFMDLWWYENSQKPFEELMEDNLRKLAKDWDRKIVLPEAREAFAMHRTVTAQQAGELPDKFLQ